MLAETRLLLQQALCLTLCLVFLGPLPGLGQSHETWEKARNDVRELSRDIRRDSALTRELISRDEQELRQELNSLKGSVARLESGLKDKQERLSGLEQQEQTLRSDLKQELADVNAVQGTVLAGVKGVQAVLQKAPFGPGLETEVKSLATLAGQDVMPGMVDIRTLVDSAFEIMEATEAITRFEGQFLQPDGQEARGGIVRVGGIEALFCTEDECGFLQPGPHSGMLRQVPGQLSWSTQRDIRAYIRGEDGHAPVDVSGGAVFQRLAGEKTWMEWVQDGGVLIWPIFGIGLLALLLGLERLFFILRIRSNSDRIMQTITSLIQEDKWSESLEFCRANRNSPTSQVMARGLECIGQSKQILDNAMQEAMLKLLPRLERFLPTLSVLAAIAPLLGLLGTVTGMISTFQTITIFGTGDAKHMAGGISEALITTQAGLMVAVPIMFLHHLLDRRIEKILGDIEEKGARLSLLLLQKGQVEDRDADHA